MMDCIVKNMKVVSEKLSSVILWLVMVLIVMLVVMIRYLVISMLWECCFVWVNCGSRILFVVVVIYGMVVSRLICSGVSWF